MRVPIGARRDVPVGRRPGPGDSGARRNVAAGLTVVGLPSRPAPAHAAAGDAVTLDAPTWLHSSGAELHWSRFAGPSVFDRYEVHRWATAGFTPSAATLLATIRDIDTTSWVDTTAAAATAFSYKVVVNGTDASNEQRVTLPADGDRKSVV